MTEEELKQYELDHTATVGEVIEYLEKNFNPTDMMCYLDVIEGVKYQCEYITPEMLGTRLMRKVSDDRKKIDNKEFAEELYRNVQDGDVILV